jgi:hypothetical protein
MLHAWFYAEAEVIVASCFAVTALLALLAYWLVLRSRLFAPVREKPAVAPFLGATNSIFALFLAFNAGHAWLTDTAAQRAATAEGAAAQRILHIVRRFHPEPAAAVAPLRAYLGAVIDQEWGRGANTDDAPPALKALRELETIAWHARAEHGMEPGLADALIRAIDALEQARATRLGLAANIGDEARWLVLTTLGFAALVGMAMSHADRPVTARFALAVFALSIASAASITAAYESPYTGLFQVKPEELAEVLAEIGQIRR